MVEFKMLKGAVFFFNFSVCECDQRYHGSASKNAVKIIKHFYQRTDSNIVQAGNDAMTQNEKKKIEKTPK